MEKPTFPKIVLITPAEIRAIRAGYRLTQEQFGRFFPVSMDTIRSWENGRSNPYGPCNVRLQVLKAWVDLQAAEREVALGKALPG
jgi:DNA-binding transcriptional regulator YiaG